MRLVNPLCRQQVSLLKRIYKSSKKHHVRQRAHCILLSSKGTKASDLALIFHKTLKTIYTWLNLWEAHRFVSLYHRKGRGRKSKLNATQKQQVKQWSKECPKNLKKVVALIKEKFGISVCKRTVVRLLRAYGFSFRRMKKKPKGKPHPVVYAQKKEELEELKKQEQQEKIDLYYFDESGFCLQPYIPYAWQEKDQTIQLEATKSKRLSVLGFLSQKHGLVAYTTEDKVDGEFVSACFRHQP
jgi:transposase